MAGNDPEEHVGPAVVRQSWRQVAFLHWRVDPSDVQPLLPAGLIPDVLDGSAWIGLTPFRVERFRLLQAPPAPFISSFAETNLRTYACDRDGRDGLWFLSLDVTSSINVAGGRLGGFRYFLSTMTVQGQHAVHYRCRRLVGPPAGHDIAVRPGPTLTELSDLESRLTGRWRAYTRLAGRLMDVPVAHERWPLRRAELLSIDETLITAAGLPPVTDAPLVHFSEGVDARFGPPRLVGHLRG